MIIRARVEGMMGRQSERAVDTALAAIEGIRTADVGMGWLEVEHDGSVTVERLVEALAIVGCTLTAASRRELRVL
jgi:hypothetical protein